MKLNNMNDQLMTMAAHRYCLGRRTYIVGCCVDWLKDNWRHFSENTRQIIFKDTVEALMDDHAGAPMDIKNWENFLMWGMDNITQGQLDWVKNSVKWKEKPWPLDKHLSQNDLATK